MLKHPDITHRRVRLFVSELKDRLYAGSQSLSIEFNENACVTDAEALKGPWKPVEKGFQWGPAYRTVWFRITGEIPSEMEGKVVRVIADVGGERTVWREGTPEFGVDHEHTDFGVLSGRAVQVSDEPAKAGEKVEILIQAYARNPQVRVHGKEPQREQLVETVGRVELVTHNPAIKELLYDAEFGLSFLDALSTDDPAYAHILRGLNDAINLTEFDNPETWSEARKAMQAGYEALTGRPTHSVTPVGHAHLDTAWLWPIEITRKKMAHTTATQLGLMERYPWYVFAHSQASQYEWLENEYPALFERVKSAIRKGQWEPVGSMWVEADCNIPSGESLVRQFLYGRKYFREKLGYETEDMFLPDVFGYSAALPQILAGFDIKYFLTQKISWNQTNKFPHNTFWWQGIDGTKVWSHFPPADTYIGNCEPQEILKSVKNHKDKARSDESLYLFGFGDGGGGPTERHLELLERGRTAPLSPRLKAGSKVVDFFREAYENSKDLATWSGELYLEFHRGTYTSQAKNKWWNRRCESDLRDAELLSAFAYSSDEYHAEDLEAAWKLVLLNQFHDIIPGSSVHEVYEDSLREYERVHATCQEVIDDALLRMGPNDGASEGMLTFFINSRVGNVAEIAPIEGQNPNWFSVGEDKVPIQQTQRNGMNSLILPIPERWSGRLVTGRFSFDPPLMESRFTASATILESPDWIVSLNENGHLTSVISKSDGQEYLVPGKPANVFEIFDDRPLFWSAWDVDPFAYETVKRLGQCESIRVTEQGPVRAAVEIAWSLPGGKSRIAQTIFLGNAAGIRFETHVDWREEDKMLKVAFPVAINSSKATYEIQYGHVERPTHYNTSWDQARFEVCAQKWVDLSEGGRGVALLNDSKYGHDIHEGVIRQTLLRSPKAPDPECDMGEHRFTYVLLPHKGSIRDADIVHHAYALNTSLRSSYLHAAQEGVGQPLAEVDTKDLVIEAVKRAEDGNGIIVRLYECHNTRGPATLRLAKPIRAAVKCNLEERTLSDLQVEQGAVTFNFLPFEIITLRLQT